MDKNVQTTDEISLAEIFKALLKKWKILVISLLVGVLLGGVFGVVSTQNSDYYGTKIVFYVNPRLEKNSSTENDSQYGVYGAYGVHVMDNMIKMLSEDLFAECLTLDVNGLPEKMNGNTALNDKITAAEAAMAEATAATADVEAAEEALESATSALTLANAKKSNAATLESLAKSRLSSAQTLATAAWKDLGCGDSTLAKINKPENELQDKEKEYNALFDAYIEATAEWNATLTDLKEKTEDAVKAAEDKTAAESDLKEKEDISKSALAAELAAKNAAVEEWRKTKAYKTQIETIRGSVAYSYYNESEDISNVENLARSFIYVKIVANDKDFAEWLYDKIIEIVPLFVEENMAVPSGYDGTNCRRTTRTDEVDRTNKGLTTSTAIKYALILGAVALVVACIAVVLIDRSDKRLRNYEATMERLNVPVLGVIPNIERSALQMRSATNKEVSK